MVTMQQKARPTRLWFHENKSFITVQGCFNLKYRNCQSPSKNSIKRWYERFKGTGNVHHKKGAGRTSVSDEVVERVMETFSPLSSGYTNLQAALCLALLKDKEFKRILALHLQQYSVLRQDI
ncbi:hypothetical protein AVEN_27260-1 [Araneus ventricosus]|uniref:DUF4817 domain-containing protein n=1 Tax=Araneus ventricosus TaxID=182803 RepID=A0A4Y2CAW3_ARAVE|nr:hypothetical protein AVEN_27260-1 [Araneus ventricosus]